MKMDAKRDTGEGPEEGDDLAGDGVYLAELAVVARELLEPGQLLGIELAGNCFVALRVPVAVDMAFILGDLAACQQSKNTVSLGP